MVRGCHDYYLYITFFELDLDEARVGTAGPRPRRLIVVVAHTTRPTTDASEFWIIFWAGTRLLGLEMSWNRLDELYQLQVALICRSINNKYQFDAIFLLSFISE